MLVVADIFTINWNFNHSATIGEYVVKIADWWQENIIFASLQFGVCWVSVYLPFRQSSRLTIKYLHKQSCQPWYNNTSVSAIVVVVWYAVMACSSILPLHDDVIKWNHFPRYWPFVRGIHRSPVNSPHKGQWRGALMLSLICALNKRLNKQSCGWWLEAQSHSLWHHCNARSVQSCFVCAILDINTASPDLKTSEYFGLYVTRCILIIDYAQFWHRKLFTRLFL